MICDFGALAWLEWRQIGNRVRGILRRPGRTALWLLFIAWIAWPMLLRMEQMRTHHYMSALQIPAAALGASAALAPSFYLALLGWLARCAAVKAPEGFGSPADAHFVCGSGLSSRAVMFWLQLRRATTLLPLFVGTVWVVLNSGHSMTLAAIAKTGGAVSLAAILADVIRMPAFLTARRCGRRTVQIIADACILLGLAGLTYSIWPALRGGNSVAGGILRSAPLPPGIWAIRAVQGDAQALVPLVAVVALAAACSSVLAVDYYPEVLESSKRMFDRKSRKRAFFGSAAAASSVVVSDRQQRRLGRRQRSAKEWPALSGAWALFWKDWVAASRASWLEGPIASLCVMAAAGLGAGLALRHLGQPGSILLVPLSLIGFLAMIFSANTAATLARDIVKPIWWLSAAALSSRLFAWAASKDLPLAAGLGAAVMCGGLGSRAWGVAVTAVPLSLTLFWLANSIGAAVYSVIPAKEDMRGPGLMLRMLLMYVLLLPCAIVAGLSQWLLHSVPTTVALGLATAAGEGFLLLLFAAARLDGNGMAFASAENM
ncbi:MAG: putative ABC exporter domain-containing protein [Candidatus Eremiobacteraeota bacterium]|nr:putative ABC exporter domain-containing protein [Candidatus Eremiobacteraeota bacterium]